MLLEGERAWLDEIAAKLGNPTWGIWLGRKCCIPAAPVLVGTAEDKAAAWRLLLARAGCAEGMSIEQFDHVIEGDEAEGLDAEWLHDMPVAFGAPIGERHAPRRILQRRRKLPANPATAE